MELSQGYHTTLSFDTASEHVLGQGSADVGTTVWWLAAPGEPHVLGKPGEISHPLWID